jgi:hypothetical protein
LPFQSDAAEILRRSRAAPSLPPLPDPFIGDGGTSGRRAGSFSKAPYTPQSLCDNLHVPTADLLKEIYNI